MIHRVQWALGLGTRPEFPGVQWALIVKTRSVIPDDEHNSTGTSSLARCLRHYGVRVPHGQSLRSKMTGLCRYYLQAAYMSNALCHSFPEQELGTRL